MIRVLVADDEAVVRAGIRTVLALDPQLRIVAEASDGRQAVELARLHTPDVALVDIRMPVLDGLSATAELRARVPETGVLLLTTFGEDDNIARGLERGANGFVLKASDPQHLLAGVRAVAAGGAYLSPEVAMRVIRGLRHGWTPRWSTARDRIEVLSPRERDVLGLIGEGLSNAQIAQRLHLVEGTVKGYVSTILDRLDVRNRVQAALVAWDAGLVDEA